MQNGFRPWCTRWCEGVLKKNSINQPMCRIDSVWIQNCHVKFILRLKVQLKMWWMIVLTYNEYKTWKDAHQRVLHLNKVLLCTMFAWSTVSMLLKDCNLHLNGEPDAMTSQYSIHELAWNHFICKMFQF